MNYEGIITFLKVQETGSLAKAAEQLFVEQGTVSRRIQQLEEELNIVLLDRKKGQRITLLTDEGKRFLPIAEQMKALFEDAQQIKSTKGQIKLRIMGTSTLTSIYLNDIYVKFMNKYPEVELITQVEHSTEIYEALNRQQCDLGFVTSLRNIPNISADRWFHDEFCILFHKDSQFEKDRQFNSLNLESEIYFRYSSEYEIWHNVTFPEQNRKKITLGNLSGFSIFLEDVDDWCILPKQTAEAFVLNHPHYISMKLKQQPPARIIYIIQNQYPLSGKKKLISAFLEMVYDTSIL